MKVRPAATSLVFFLFLLSCADAPADPGAGDSIDHSTDGHDILVRVAFEGGFVAPQWTYTSIPSFSLYGDGTLVLPGRRWNCIPPQHSLRSPREP